MHVLTYLAPFAPPVELGPPIGPLIELSLQSLLNLTVMQSCILYIYIIDTMIITDFILCILENSLQFRLALDLPLY